MPTSPHQDLNTNDHSHKLKQASGNSGVLAPGDPGSNPHQCQHPQLINHAITVIFLLQNFGRQVVRGA
jgi:hypothetical protein